MIISQQMQGPVQSKLTQLANLAMTDCPGLAPGSFERDYDLAEKEPARGESITVWKGKYIGLPIESEESSIQLTNGPVIGKHEMDLGLLLTESAQTAGDNPPQLLSCWLRRSSFPPDVDPSHLTVASC